jgi:hypothetical protein
MSIMFSYNLTGATSDQTNRVQSIFERFGWENVGGSCYRYPPLQPTPPAEDWLNNVIPALMLFRAFILKQGITVERYSLDAQSSTGYSGSYSNPIQAAGNIKLFTPKQPQFGLKHLKAWVDGTATSIPY